MYAVTYLLKTVLLITAGVILANGILESSVLSKVSPLIRPLCRASNLPKEGAVSLFASFFNPTAGKSTLAGFYHEGKLGEKETILTVLMSTFPIVVGESLFRVHAPIALVLLGPVLGGIYLALGLLAAFLQSFAALIYAKLRFTPPSCLDDQIYAGIARLSSDEKLKTALKKSFNTLKQTIPILVASFVILELLFQQGVMNHISLLFDPLLRVFDLPGEVITALIAEIAHFSAAYATVSALLTKGVITGKQAILTLLVGSMISITLVYVKYSFSMYLSLFGKLGVKITLITYLSSMVAKLCMILLVILVM